VRSVVFGRGHSTAEHQPQIIHQQMAFTASDPLAGVIPKVTTVAGGLDALTVQNGGGGSAALGVGLTHENAQSVVEQAIDDCASIAGRHHTRFATGENWRANSASGATPLRRWRVPRAKAAKIPELCPTGQIGAIKPHGGAIIRVCELS
jgi:hypothetical protein